MYILDYKINNKLNKLRDTITKEFILSLGTLTTHKQTLAERSVGCFINNTYYVSKVGRDKIGVTLRPNSYKTCHIINGKSTGRKISYTYTMKLFDFLVENEYITLYRGGVVEYGVSRGRWGVTKTENSYITMLPKLKSLYLEYDVVKIKEKDNVIIVRENEVDVTFRMNTKTRGVKELLDRYNKLTLGCSVGNQKKENIYDVQLHKVFNGKSYKKGGRSYMSGMGIQGLSKEERQRLTINGEETVVYDYSAFEPSIAYSMCGEIMDGDPYTIELEGYAPSVLRNICKLCLLIMFNIDDKKSLARACNEIIRDSIDVVGLHKEGKIPERIDVKTILEELTNKHYLIREMLYCNSPTEPAYVGSLVTDYITDYFTQRDILVLSVFDEFIIQSQHEEELKTVMKSAYDHVLGFSDNARIRKEK